MNKLILHLYIYIYKCMCVYMCVRYTHTCTHTCSYLMKPMIFYNLFIYRSFIQKSVTLHFSNTFRVICTSSIMSDIIVIWRNKRTKYTGFVCVCVCVCSEHMYACMDVSLLSCYYLTSKRAHDYIQFDATWGT